jgi:hypothetical protein
MIAIILAMYNLCKKVGSMKFQKLLMLKGMMMHTSLKCASRICKNKDLFGSHIVGHKSPRHLLWLTNQPMDLDHN